MPEANKTKQDMSLYSSAHDWSHLPCHFSWVERTYNFLVGLFMSTKEGGPRRASKGEQLQWLNY